MSVARGRLNVLRNVVAQYEAQNGNGDAPALEIRAEPHRLVRILEGDAPSPPEQLVTNLLVDHDVNLWTGHGGAAKSTVALDVAISVALGAPVFGSLTVQRTGPVLILAPEDGQGGIRATLDALIAGRGLGDAAIETLTDRLIVIDDDEPVNLTTDAARLGADVEEVGAVLLMLDPLRYLLGGASEIDPAIATSVCDALRRRVCRDAGAAVWMSHHNKKPGRDDRDAEATAYDAGGTMAWSNSARAHFAVVKKGDRITLSVVKANRLPSTLRHELLLDVETDTIGHWTSARLTNANAGAHSDALTPGVGRPPNANEHAALACLNDQHEPGLRLSHTGWRDAFGLPPGTFRHVKERLLDAGLVDAKPTGQNNPNRTPRYTYGLTDRGRQLLIERANR